MSASTESRSGKSQQFASNSRSDAVEYRFRDRLPTRFPEQFVEIAGVLDERLVGGAGIPDPGNDPGCQLRERAPRA
jgi:hypothetical protein